MTAISEDEAAIYDRQIRLWGVESQQRLQSASVLLIGTRAYAAEIAKNLVLAGVGSLCLQDGTPVSEPDLGANFLLRAEDLGRPRGEAMLPRLAALNPRVKFSASSEPAASATVAGHTTVCVTDDVGQAVLVRRAVSSFCSHFAQLLA